MPHSPCQRVLSLFLLFAAAAVTARSQNQTATIRAETRIVVVDAVVTDDAGNHVSGLTEKDFTLLEDKHPQKIAAFSFEDGTSAPSALPPLAPDVYTNRPEYRGGTGPVVVFLLDAINTPLAAQVYMQQQVADYFRRGALPPGQFAIYVLGDSLTVAQDFTADPKLLLAATERFKPRQPFALAMANAHSSMQADVAGLVAQDEAQSSLAAMRLVARSVARFHGRKILVWLSAGLPASLMDPLASRRFDFSAEVRQTANLLAESEVSVYPIDVRGLVTAGGLDASHAGFDTTAGPASQAILASEQSTMELLAIETGGRATRNNNRLDTAVAQTVADDTGYYSLAYYPDNKKWDQKFRKIEVKVSRPGLHVLARRGYYALDPFKRNDKEQEKEFIALLLAGGPAASMVDFDAQLKPAPAAIRVDLLVDPIALQGNDTPEGSAYSLEWHAIAIATDKKRTIAAHLDQQVTTSVSDSANPSVRQKGVPLHGELAVPPGEYVLHLGVRDLRTGKYGTLEVPLTVAGK